MIQFYKKITLEEYYKNDLRFMEEKELKEELNKLDNYILNEKKESVIIHLKDLKGLIIKELNNL